MSLAQGNNTPTRPRIEPGSPDPESDALTTRPVRPPSSNYVAIHQQKVIAILCFEGISNFVQRYWHSNWCQPRPKFDITYAKFEFEYPEDLEEDLDTLKDREGKR